MKTNLPGGYLLLREDGSIEGIPPFLSEALQLDKRESKCIYDFFDTEQFPHLSATRVVRYGDTTEYHVSLVLEDGFHRGFRYWDASTEKQVRFYFIDDSSIHQSHEWEYRKLRSFILNDIETFFSSKIENKLTTLRVLSEVMRDSPKIKEDALERLLHKLEELEHLVDSVSSEIRASDGPESFVSVELNASELEDIMQSWSNDTISVHTEIEKNIKLDSGMLDAIIFPLVQNAIESKPVDSRIAIHIKFLDTNILEFKIIDRGVGMTQHELERAEDPFFTTKRGHTGLGIPRALEHLRRRNGSWEIQSIRKHGTTFLIYLPLESAS